MLFEAADRISGRSLQQPQGTSPSRHLPQRAAAVTDDSMARSKGVPVSGTGIGGTAKEGSVGQAWRGFLRGTADVQDPAGGHVDTQVKAPGAGGTAGPGEGGLAVLARTLMRACLRARPRPPLLPPRASPWGRHRCSGLGPSLTICAWCFQAASAHTGLPSSSHLPALCPPQASSPVELPRGPAPQAGQAGAPGAVPTHLPAHR